MHSCTIFGYFVWSPRCWQSENDEFREKSSGANLSILHLSHKIWDAELVCIPFWGDTNFLPCKTHRIVAVFLQIFIPHVATWSKRQLCRSWCILPVEGLNIFGDLANWWLLVLPFLFIKWTKQYSYGDALSKYKKEETPAPRNTSILHLEIQLACT